MTLILPGEYIPNLIAIPMVNTIRHLSVLGVHLSFQKNKRKEAIERVYLVVNPKTICLVYCSRNYLYWFDQTCLIYYLKMWIKPGTVKITKNKANSTLSLTIHAELDQI